MRLICSILLGLTAGLSYGAIASLEAQDHAARARAAIRYLERGERSNGGTRTITAAPAAIGIDVNSSVDILVDEDALRTLTAIMLPDAHRADLTMITRRIGELEALLDQLSAVTTTLEELVTAAQDEDVEDFIARRRASSRAAAGVFDALEAAIGSRLEAEGTARASLQQTVDDILNRTQQGPGRLWNFQWDTVAVIMREEIESLRGDLDGRLNASSVTARIQANLLRPDGPNPIFLPGYNQVETGPAERYPKVAFAISEEEERAFAGYDSLASRIRETNDARGEITALLRRETVEQFPEIERLLATAAALDGAVGAIAARMSGLGAQLDATIRQLDNELRAQADSLTSELEAFGLRLLRDVAPAKALLSLRSPTAGMTAVDAMQEILGALQFLDEDALEALRPERWTARGRELDDILSGAPDDAAAFVRGSTGGLLDELTNSLVQAGAVLQDVRSSTLVLLERLRTNDAINVPLALPPGLTARGFSSGLDTRLDLMTIAGGREPGQRIVLTYELLQDDEVLLEWTDDLLIQSYGLSGATSASLAFVQRQGESKFEPNPIITWTLRYRGWPGDDERGVGTSIFSHLGFGLSTTTLDFVEDESVEIGLAATLSLGDLIFVGGGINLQASDDRTFWFFSFRLLEMPGVFGALRQ
ncbi:MAG: hypothetical protein BMS9Abin29_1744 [Gemmatimonadota bacterium]|nr:MAG: hypothetical protein BMS9Abin29_1744 [Gemmatimonadota bacterium]